jgi:CBS-domain-containing membrane protein
MIHAELSTVVTYNPLSLAVDNTLADILRLWTAMELHDWPVVDHDQQLVGILSEADIIRAIGDLAAAYSIDPRLGRKQLSLRTAQQIMSPVGSTIPRHELKASALYQLLTLQRNTLPVVEEDRLVGLVSTTDFLREFSYGHWSLGREPVTHHIEELPESVDCSASWEAVEQTMFFGISELIAVTTGALTLGVVTRRDLRLAKCRLDARRILSDEISVTGPVTLRELAAQSPLVRPGARLSEAASLMVETRRQAVAVANQAGRFMGALTDKGILRAMLGHESWQVGTR